jgi:hypothetical protein
LARNLALRDPVRIVNEVLCQEPELCYLSQTSSRASILHAVTSFKVFLVRKGWSDFSVFMDGRHLAGSCYFYMQVLKYHSRNKKKNLKNAVLSDLEQFRACQNRRFGRKCLRIQGR